MSCWAGDFEDVVEESCTEDVKTASKHSFKSMARSLGALSAVVVVVFDSISSFGFGFGLVVEYSRRWTGRLNWAGLVNCEYE